jgi:Uri superfamily endonuclease
MTVPGPLVLDVGRLGPVRLPAGTLRYFGSAYGPGGLRARVRRHLARENRRDRWHIDAVTRALGVGRILLVPGGRECDLATEDLAGGHWTTPFRASGRRTAAGAGPTSSTADF